MSTYPVDIKSTNLTSTGTIFAGPCRVLGVYYDATAGAGTIEILDNATSLCTLNTPDGSTYSHSQYLQFPGTGLRCLTSGKATLTTINKVTFFYG